MKRAMVRVGLAVALVGAGWAAGKAQTSTPDFELIINAPTGNTTIECLRGCKVKWIERGINARSLATPSFEYGCGGERCVSGRVGGWLEK